MIWLKPMRWNALAMLGGGCLWSSAGLFGLWLVAGAGDQASSLRTGLGLAPWVLALAAALLLLGISSLRCCLTQRNARYGRPGLVVAQASLALFALVEVAQSMLGAWSGPLVGLGIIGMSAGLVLFGSAALQQVQTEGWQALPLMLGLLGLFLPIGAGVAGVLGMVVSSMFGLGWCWLGLILWLEQPVVVQHVVPAAERVSRRGH